MNKAWWKVNDSLWQLYDRLKNYIKFSLVGILGVAINFSLLYTLTEFAKLWYIGSATIAIFVAGSSNYVLNHYWTFKDKKEYNSNMLVGWAKYMTAIGLTELLYLGLMYVLTDKIGLFYMLSAFLALSMTTVLRYISADKWVWKTRKQKQIV